LVAAGSSTIDISRDTAKTEADINKFVAAFNELRANFDVLEASSPGNRAGLRQIEQGFSDILGQAATVDGADAYLFEVGITRDKTGAMVLDTTELSDALASDFDRVSQLFADATTGFANRLYDFADQVLDDIVPSREDGLDSRKRTLATQIERQEIHLDVYEQTLIERFAALDITVSSLTSTSNYLSNFLSSSR